MQAQLGLCQLSRNVQVSHHNLGLSGGEEVQGDVAAAWEGGHRERQGWLQDIELVLGKTSKSL